MISLIVFSWFVSLFLLAKTTCGDVCKRQVCQSTVLDVVVHVGLAVVAEQNKYVLRSRGDFIRKGHLDTGPFLDLIWR